MASPNRPPRDPVDAPADPLEAIRADPYRFGLFHALRWLESTLPASARLGRSGVRPVNEPLRLAQEPTLAFAPSSLAGLDAPPEGSRRKPRLRVHGFGLFGPNGPLPRHLTEYAMERRSVHRDRALIGFADLFHHRLLSLFYRAWADSEPTVSHDHPEDDRFADYVAALVGFGTPSLRGRDALPDAVRLHFAGHLVGQARTPDGLCAMVAGFLGVPAAIDEFVPAWLELPPAIRWRLGDRRSGRLGDGLPVGARVPDAQHRFRLVLGPLSLAEHRWLGPGGAGLERLTALVRTHLGDELAWEVRLVLRAREVPPLRLDGSVQLGRTAWLARFSWPASPHRRDADDLTFDPLVHHTTRADGVAPAGA